MLLAMYVETNTYNVINVLNLFYTKDGRDLRSN